jgi:hypothetical protein
MVVEEKQSRRVASFLSSRRRGAAPKLLRLVYVHISYVHISLLKKTMLHRGDGTVALMPRALFSMDRTPGPIDLAEQSEHAQQLKDVSVMQAVGTM